MEWLTAEAGRALLGGAIVTVVLTVVTSGLSTILGIVVGGLRHNSSRRWHWPASVFVEVFRNVPTLIQIIFWAFAFPTIFPDDLRSRIFFNNALFDRLSDLTGLPLPYYALAAVLGLTLNTAAHLADVFRAGLAAVPHEQVESARTLGAGRWAVFTEVLFPGGIRACFPALTTRLIHNLKNTALASFVAVPELFHEIQASINMTFRATEYLMLAAVMYLVLSFVLGAALGRIDRRLQVGVEV